MTDSDSSRARLLAFTARPVSPERPEQLAGQWQRIVEPLSEDGSLLDKLAQRLQVQSLHLVATAWAVVLARCTGATEAAIGMTGSDGRILALQPGVGDDDNALTLCERMATAVAAASQPVSVPDATQAARPDIDVLLLDSPDREATAGASDWLVTAVEKDRQVRLVLWFNSARIDVETAAGLLQSAAMALRAMLAAPERALTHLQFINQRPMRALNDIGSLERWHYDGPGDVAGAFASRVAAAPNAPALRFSLPGHAVTQWTYRELDAASDRWAQRLTQLGIGPGDTIGMTLPRGPAAIALMLGALRIRAAYLPLDPMLPRERLAHMLRDAKAIGIVVAPGHESAFAPGTNLLHVDPASPDGLPAQAAAAQPAAATATSTPRAQPHDVAYVMYTSGSTGQPKGIAITHQAIVRLVCAARFMRLSPAVAMLHAAPLGFDASTLEIWGPLLNGGVCVIYTDPLPTSHDIADTIQRHGANAAWLTAALFNAIVDDDPLHLSGLTQVLTGGEALSVPHVRRARRALPAVTLINGYGPTESTTFTCTHTIVDMPRANAGSIPIGRPVSATWLAVVNERLQAVPPGIIGELLIGGVGLTQGYLNLPDETRRRFIDNPFGEGPARLYRSGDRVRLLPDGALEFIGRVDDQVKIRGFRVEPREIEAIIQTDSAVRQCAVLTQRNDVLGVHFLAWISPADDADKTAFDLAALRARLAQRLPDYMMPAAFAVIDDMPVTRNGKLDRRALPAFPETLPGAAGRTAAAPAGASTTPASVTPSAAVAARRTSTGNARAAGTNPAGRSSAAQALARQAWRSGPDGAAARQATPANSLAEHSVASLEPLLTATMGRALDQPGFAANSHFFESGGNSLLAIQLLATLRSQSNIACPVGALYSHPTPATLAQALIEQNRTGSAGSVAGRSALPDHTEAAPCASPTSADMPGHAIAIIGMAARYPGAPDLAAFAANLAANVDSIRRFTAEQIDASIDPALRDDPSYVKARGVIDGVENFDAAFFGIAPREAELLDPQQRIFLQLCWSCLEHGGYVPDATTEPVGVFAGMYNASYLNNNLRSHPDRIAQLGEFLVMLGNEKDYIATRTAHRLNLTGPAISIHTACSTSLVAIVQACESLATGQCAMALAGGVSVTSPPASGHLFSEGAMLSPDGLTRSFDAQAAGTVFSDGAGVVLLKRLADAQRDGDTIHAVIRGGAINNDGGGKASFMAPSAAGQTRVIRQAMARAKVAAASIDYIETHGTATPSGDPIEVDALKQAFADVQVTQPSCALGSVKSNIGHTVTAAGVAGVIRTVLALHAERIPATLHFTTLNPAISLAGTPFRIADAPIAWPHRADRPRRAGVSSFGVGGTNAHLILEEAPPVAPEPRNDTAATEKPAAQVLRLSAASEASLARSLAALADHLSQDPAQHTRLDDVAHTLNVARKPMRWRTTVVADSIAAAVTQLRAGPALRDTGVPQGRQRPIVFVFPGQGAQYLQMGSGLMQTNSVFAQAYTDAMSTFVPLLGIDLETLLLTGTDATRLAQTAVLQPALFCIEYALARMLIAAGLEPAAMIGHSIGEYAAAACANVISLEDAAYLVAQRGSLMQAQPPGRMLSVRLPAAQLQALLPAGIDLAADNGPGSSVCSGPAQAIAEFGAALQARDIISRELHTSHAFHSVMMNPAAVAFADEFRDIRLHAPTRRIVSTLTGDLLSDDEARNPDYWASQLRQPVRFAPAICAAMAALDDPIFIEVGPRASLSPMIRQLRVDGRARPSVVALLSDNAAAESDALAQAFGQLWCEGIACDGLLHTAGRRIALPTYSFDPHRHWLDAAPFGAAANPGAGAPPALREPAAGTEQNAAESAAALAAATLSSAAARSASTVSSGHAAVAVPAEEQDPGAALGARLRELLEEASGLEFDATADAVPFAELGLDSLSLTQIAMQVKRTFKVDVGFRQLMQEHDSIARLTAWLVTQMPATARSAGTQAGATADDGTSARAGAANAETAGIAAPEAPADLSGADVPVPSARPFGAIARIQTAQTELTASQRDFIAQIIKQYVARTRASKAYAQQHRKTMADPRVVTGFKPIIKEITYPLVIKRSHASRLWDLDGNEYIDVLNGFGMNLFGWQPEFVTQAVQAALESGYEIGPQHPLAGVVAQGVCDLTGADRAALCNTGSEAVMGATRIARTVTGRTKIVVFDGAYHGIFDEVIVRGTRNNRAVPAAPGIMPNTSQNVISLPYGTPESLAVIRAMSDDIAAVLVEPVQSRRPDFQPVEFLKELRAITQESGSVLVFDEVVTGFRSHPGGIQALFDIRADLVTYGKVIGGGFPIGIIAGKREFMDALDGGHWQFGDASVPEVGVTYFAGTFVRHPLALAAASAVIGKLKAEGPSLQADLNARTTEFAEEMNAFASSMGAPVEIRHFSSFWRIVFTAEHPMQEMLFPLMRMSGVHVLDGFPCFFTIAHSVADIEHVKNAFCDAVRQLRSSALLPRIGSRPGVLFDAKCPPVPGARLGRDRNGKPAWYVPNPDIPGKFLRIDEHV